ncbi:MAG TPA: hypothetical protein VF041_00305 [Gemmatimonadaceae bacterium]
MSTIAHRAEVPPHPFPPVPAPAPKVPDVHVHPPLVFVEPVWEYRHMVRNLDREAAPSDEEMNALGGEGWELIGVFGDGRAVHLYFKRQLR